MARSIDQIEISIKNKLGSLKLSDSYPAEWKTWVHCFAYVIYTFELMLDCFRNEMDKKAESMYAGSLAWYNEMCYRFQMGDELMFDNRTARIYYEKEDEGKKIIKAAAVTVSNQCLLFKVATQKDDKLVKLGTEELTQFAAYLDRIKFAGTQTALISDEPDTITYRITLYYDPSYEAEALLTALKSSLDAYQSEQKFGGMIYRHKVLEAVTRVPGVVTAGIDSLAYRRNGLEKAKEIKTFEELHAGYFMFDHPESRIEINNSQAPNNTKIGKL